ncbi:hypothetical protein CTKA_01722 [Chthonomonas calidirosea]|uniref:Uncharacterized protein n=2 Tax=Chthonomonas TaxID=1077265 RepID=S0EXG9_CHTCT|nr:hypothetical protein [Chthonomonas calidirosea]CCW36178.1 hypothetical protein CCALI_02374 [Chthonomonas calidirosea T49]CEK18109.1 hypothetical protein CTKA_01722 [Chthonomonas calidirosea]
MSEADKTDARKRSKRPVSSSVRPMPSPPEQEIELLYLRWHAEIESGQTRTLEEWLRETPEYLHEELWNLIEIESLSHAAEQEEIAIPPELEARFEQHIQETIERYFPTRERADASPQHIQQPSEISDTALQEQPLTLTRLQKLLKTKRSLHQWAQTLHMPVPFFNRLLRAHLHPDSVPEFVYQKLAEAAELSIEQVRVAFAQSRPFLSPNAAFRAEAAPQLPDQQDFWEALFSESTLSEEDRKFWEAMRPR